jgi:TetR/AcrR family transcriptional regulator, transcriptional repressor for nem operon
LAIAPPGIGRYFFADRSASRAVAEVCTQEDHRLQKKIQEILEYKRKYLESAIRDAHAAGLVNAPDAVAKSRILFAYYQGLQTQARIQNKLDVLKDSIIGTYELLGVKNIEPMAA